MKTYFAYSTSLMSALAALALGGNAHAALIHRYAFNEATGSPTAKDLVGTADGVIKGTGAYFDGTGHLVLPGGTGSAADAASIAGYVDLPNHLINVLTNLTIETWVTWSGSGAWQRVFDFGTSDGGEDVSNGNGNYLFMSPQGDANLRFAVRDPATGTEPVQLTAAAPLDRDTEVCLTVTYDFAGNAARLYSNAVLVASGPASVPLKTIDDVNNWLGRSQWNDAMFAGSYNEFRIYDNALTTLEVTASFLSGPEKPSTDISSLGSLDAVHLLVSKTTMSQYDKQTVSATVDFAKAKGMSLAGIPGVTYQSDNTNALTIKATGEVEAIAAGTAKLSVSYQGKTDSVSVVVNARTQGPVVAGTLYVDLRAADESASTVTWVNRAGKGDFNSVGSPVFEADVAGTGLPGVKFNGTTDAYQGPNTTSDLDGGSDRSIEVWAYNPALADEETLVAWGHRGGPTDSNMSFNYGSNPTWGAVGHWGDDMGWTGAPPTPGQWHYLVYTYDGARTAKVYADGLLRTTRAVGQQATFPDLPIRLGAQANTSGSDFDFGQALSGDLALVRVHGGLLSEADVTNNFLYGIELTAPGAFQGVSLKLSAAKLVGAGAQAQATVTANYANRKYLIVNGSSTFQSSDDSVAKVDTAGVVTAVSIGSATITASYQGKQDAQALEVVGAPLAVLKHRYSFSEAAGSTTVKDSVGNADGVIKGNGATFNGQGQLSLPGGTGSAADASTIAGYVDLPNHIINVFTNISIEAWVTWQGSASAWQRIFDFGTSQGGEDIASGNGNYLFLSPQGDANLRFAVRDPATGTEPVQLTAPRPLPRGPEICVTVTYNYTNNAARLYTNAVLLVSGPASVALSTIDDVNNWLGRSQWNDPMFQGKFNEFRIWDGAMSADQVAANVAAGPDKLPEPVTAKPKIGVAIAGASLTLSWPATATGFALESTTELGAKANWGTVDLSQATEQNGTKKINLSIDAKTRFYRLKK